jgi:signal transduction histidine kinase
MKDANHKLRERVKELNCLYEISKVAVASKNDIKALASRTLKIIPQAMQYPDLAEIEIKIGDTRFSTSLFEKNSIRIKSALSIDKKVYGSIAIGYRKKLKGSHRINFLPEEKRLLRAVAQEFSRFLETASTEDDKQKLKVQLQHVERLAFVGELSAGVAHELNEPLAKILGFAQLIKKAGNLNDQQTEDIERIVKASLYTREIIKKLMIFSRQMPQQITKVNLNEVIGNILYFIDVRFQSRGIKLKTKLDKKLPLIDADEVQLSQVLVNLITNAVHAMPKGGEIIVSTKARGKIVSLVVSDTGSGMSPDVKQKMFEPFFTTKPVGQGTGLGLSVVKGIIDAHNGKSIVNSTLGKGTRFEIHLPLKAK